ncbi:unnamed protein product [Closterium sp. NIES-64]|nr:unnamed protein product [Closterium sp. NIES-64]
MRTSCQICRPRSAAPPARPAARHRLTLWPTLRVLSFDTEGRPVEFDAWLDDLQLFLISTSKDEISLFDHTSGALVAPADTAALSKRSQWLTCDAAARLAIRNHLPLAELKHFGEHKTAKALYDAVVARYSSLATAALSRLMLPYLFPELSSFATVADLITHLRSSDARVGATLRKEFVAQHPPPMYWTLHFIVTRLPDTLRSVRDHFLARCPSDLTIDLLEEHLLAAESSIVSVVAARGAPRTPIFEGCASSPLAPSYATSAAVVSLEPTRLVLPLLLPGGAAPARARGARAVVEVAAEEEVEEVGVVVGVEAVAPGVLVGVAAAVVEVVVVAAAVGVAVVAVAAVV